jgi:hypothetical protein
MIDKGDWIQIGILAIALIGAINWAVVAGNGEGLIEMALSSSQNVQLARGVVGVSGGILVTEALGATDVTDIGWN